MPHRIPRSVPAVLVVATLGCGSTCGVAPSERVVSTDSIAAGGDSLTFRARASVHGTDSAVVQLDAVITNTSPGVAQVTLFRFCPVVPRFYASGRPASRPSWDGLWPPCMFGGRLVRLPVGGAESLHVSLGVRSILGDSLAGGIYLVRAAFQLEGRIVEVDAGRLTLSR